jgi:hypothetical protein
MMPWRHRPASMRLLPEKLTMALFCHPAGTRKVRFVDATSALRVAIRIEAEEDADGFAPIGSIGLSVEKTDVELEMPTIIVGQSRAFGRLIEKIQEGHAGLPLLETATAAFRRNATGLA